MLQDNKQVLVRDRTWEHFQGAQSHGECHRAAHAGEPHHDLHTSASSFRVGELRTVRLGPRSAAKGKTKMHGASRRHSEAETGDHGAHLLALRDAELRRPEVVDQTRQRPHVRRPGHRQRKQRHALRRHRRALQSEHRLRAAGLRAGDRFRTTDSMTAAVHLCLIINYMWRC